MFYNLLPSALQALLRSALWPQAPQPIPHSTLQFELRHQHALSNTSRTVFSDITPASALGYRTGSFAVPTRRIPTHKPVAQAAFQSARFRGGSVHWDTIETEGPEVQDREGLLMLAKMANNAYTEPDKSDWYALGSDWNTVRPPSPAYIPSQVDEPRRSRTPLGGSLTRTDSVDTSLRHPITPPWSSLSRARPSCGPSAVGARHSARTS